MSTSTVLHMGLASVRKIEKARNMTRDGDNLAIKILDPGGERRDDMCILLSDEKKKIIYYQSRVEMKNGQPRLKKKKYGQKLIL